MTFDNDNKLINLFNKYHFDNQSKKEFLDIIKPIYIHDEFQKRMTNEYLHHDKITLGEHILEDSIITYMLSKKYLNKKKKDEFNIAVAVKMAMLHDLYTLPWQNNPSSKMKKMYNKHGFRHPIEAVINASIWFPEIFKNEEEANKIIDGIVHHMYPLPVRRYSVNDKNSLELENFDIIYKMSSNNKKILEISSNKMKIGPFSLKGSKYKEGIIMRKADKKVSMDNFRRSKSLRGVIALITGRNKNIV